MLHNIDTLGADVDPTLLGLHIRQGACLTFEVITRRIEDRGGGLARVNGRVRLVEGLAMPREEDEFDLTYYNTMTTWIDIDQLLTVFGLTRARPCQQAETVAGAIRNLGAKMPTYVTLKDVKKRWGHGQEDIFPVTQFEKLWGDMTALPEVSLPLRSCAPPARPATQGPGPARWLAQGRLRRLRRIALPVDLIDSYPTPRPSSGTSSLTSSTSDPSCTTTKLQTKFGTKWGSRASAPRPSSGTSSLTSSTSDPVAR